MLYYAVCQLKNSEYECIRVEERSLVKMISKKGSIILNIRETLTKVVEQLHKDNKTRKDNYKITKFIDFVEHDTGIDYYTHKAIVERWCRQASEAYYPYYDFEHPEKGIN